MASFWGRALRGIVGLCLIWWGFGTGSVVGMIIAVIGAIMVIAAILNVCLIGPLFGLPLKGKDVMNAPPQMPQA